MMDDAQTDAPLPCPFCGVTPEMWLVSKTVNCANPRCALYPHTSIQVELWNRRAALASPRALEGEQTMREWVIERWDAEVANRPLANIHRRTLDNTWRQVYRWLTDEELPRPKQESAVPRAPDWRDSEAVKKARETVGTEIRKLTNPPVEPPYLPTLLPESLDALCDAVAEYVQSHARPSKGE